MIIVKKLLLFTALYAFFAYPTVSSAELPWKIWKKNSTQTVSYRPVSLANSADEKLIEIRATAIVNSTLAGFLLFIDDVTNTPNWLVSAGESKILQRYSATENSFYITLTKVWPLQSRILILHSTYWQNDDLSIEINVKDATYAQAMLITGINKDKYLQVKTHRAHWQITPIKREQRAEGNNNDYRTAEILLEYTFIADGRGDTPTWLADHFALKSIWKTLGNIKRQLPDKKWQQQTLKGITELTVLPTP